VRTKGSLEVRNVIVLIVLLGAITLLMEFISSCINWVRTFQTEILKDHITSLIHQKSITADLAFYELADYYDHLHRARTEASYRPVALLENLGALLQNGITLIAMVLILLPFGPWLSLVLLLSTFPAFFVVIGFALEEYQWRQRTTADERRSWYYDWLMTSAEAAAELRLFGLGKYFQTKYDELRKALRKERLHLVRRQGIAELVASVLAITIVGLTLGWMVWKALHGTVSLGELAMVYAAFVQGQKLMRTILENAGKLYGNSLFLGNLFEFLGLPQTVAEVEPAKAKLPPGSKHAITFSNVSFKYPDSAVEALSHFDMTIPAGKIVAIVGPNGAGKSTLVKLLCRFYDPDAGAINIDNCDLREIPSAYLRRLVSVLFQIPQHYNTTLTENIHYGDIEKKSSDSDITEAIKAAGAESIVSKLPNGPATLLGKWFTGGVELSVGEWQRIALARAFLRKAPILILDEPTSALDPWSEADWLQRFRSLAAEQTALIITHRFTTAMHADIIHVMQDGKIIESGNHNELLEQNGLYAESWMKQVKAADLAVPQEIG